MAGSTTEAHLTETFSDRYLSLEPWWEPQPLCLSGLSLQLACVVCPAGVLSYLGKERFCCEWKSHLGIEDCVSPSDDLTSAILVPVTYYRKCNTLETKVVIQRLTKK